MKYEVTFFDKSHLVIDELEMVKVTKAMGTNIKFITLKEGIYATSSIAKVEKRKEEAKNLLPEGRQNLVSPETKARLDKLYRN